MIEAELAEEGADLDELTGAPGPTAPGPRRRRQEGEATQASRAGPVARGRRQRRTTERSPRLRPRTRSAAAPAGARRRSASAARKESEKRREAPAQPTERQRGGVIGFFVSCWAELKRVQWPDRETLIQASAVTVIFIAVMAAYLGALDALFNWLVQRIL